MDDFVCKLPNGELCITLSEESLTATLITHPNIRQAIILDISEARELSDWLRNHPALED